MGKKPTYEQLEKRVKEVEAQLVKIQLSDEALLENKPKYRQFYESMPDAFARIDMTGRILEFNRAFEKMLGYSAEELQGRHYRDITPKRWHDFEEHIIYEQIGSLRHTEVYEKEYVRKDGCVLPIELHTFLVKDDRGQPSGMWAIIRDITDRKKTEKMLRQSEEKFSKVFSTVPDAIVISRVLDGLMLEVNPGFEKATGYARNEVVGRTSGEFGLWFDASEREEVVSRLQAEGEILDREFLYRRKDGSIRRGIISAHLISIVGEDCMVFVMHDVTDWRRAEEELGIVRNQILSVFDSIEGPIYVSDPQTYELLFVNESLKKIIGNVVGQKCYRAFHNMDSPCPFCTDDRIFGENLGKRYVWEHDIGRLDRWFHCTDRAVRWIDGRIVRLEMAVDITEHKKMEEALREKQVDLENNSRYLQELNSALRVLLKQREEDKNEIKESVISNVKGLVIPHLERVLKSSLKERQRRHLEIAFVNLNEIVSPFMRRLSLEYFRLTPTELQVASLIRHGYRTKEIAEALDLSTETIRVHRRNIRRKVGIKDNKINLRSYLLSIQEKG